MTSNPEVLYLKPLVVKSGIVYFGMCWIPIEIIFTRKILWSFVEWRWIINIKPSVPIIKSHTDSLIFFVEKVQFSCTLIVLYTKSFEFYQRWSSSRWSSCFILVCEFVFVLDFILNPSLHGEFHILTSIEKIKFNVFFFVLLTSL